MPSTPETTRKSRTSLSSSRKKGLNVEENTPVGKKSTEKIRSCSLRLRKLDISNGLNHVTNNKTTQDSAHGKVKLSGEAVGQRTLRKLLQGRTDSKDEPVGGEKSASQEKVTEAGNNKNGQWKHSSAETNRTGNLEYWHPEPKKAPKAGTKSLLSMRIALADVELGSKEDDTLFKTGAEKKKDTSASELTVINTPNKKNTNVKGAFPYTGIGRPSKYNIPTVSGGSRAGSNVTPTTVKDVRKPDGTEFQTCKIAKLQGNGSSIEWIQVDLTEASINDYIKSKGQKQLDQLTTPHSKAQNKEKTFNVKANVQKSPVKQRCIKNLSSKNSSKTSDSVPKVADKVGNKKEGNKESVVVVVPNHDDKVNQRSDIAKEDVPCVAQKKVLSCTQTGCVFTTSSESCLRRHISTHFFVPASLPDHPKKKTPHQKRSVSGTTKNTTNDMILGDETERKPNRCEEQVCQEKEGGTLREVPDKETLSETMEVQEQHQEMDKMEDIPESDQDSCSEAVVSVKEQDKAIDEVQDVPTVLKEEDSGFETQPETVVSAEEDMTRDKVQDVPTVLRKEDSGFETQPEAVVPAEEDMKIDELDDVPRVLKEEDSGFKTHLEAVDHVEEGITRDIEDDVPRVLKEEDSGFKTHLEAVDHVEEGITRDIEDDVPRVLKEEDSGFKTHSETAVPVEEDMTIDEVDDVPKVLKEEYSGFKTHPKEVDCVEEDMTMGKVDDVPKYLTEKDSGFKTQPEPAAPVIEQEKTTDEFDNISEFHQEVNLVETDLDLVPEAIERQGMDEVKDTAVIQQHETNGNTTHSETAAQVLQQHQATVQEESLPVIHKDDESRIESPTEAAVQIRDQQQDPERHEEDFSITQEQEITGEEGQSGTVVQVEEQYWVLSEEEELPCSYQQEITTKDNCSETTVQVHQEMKEEKDMPVFTQQGISSGMEENYAAVETAESAISEKMEDSNPKLNTSPKFNGQFRLADMAEFGYVVSSGSDAETDVYSFPEDNSVHEADDNSVIQKSSPDTEDTTVEETLPLDFSIRCQEESNTKKSPPVVFTGLSQEPSAPIYEDISDDDAFSRGTSPLTVKDVTAPIEASLLTLTDLSEDDTESGESPPPTYGDFSQDCTAVQEASPSAIADVTVTEKVSPLLCPDDIVLNEAPPDDVTIGEGHTLEVTDTSQTEGAVWKEAMGSQHPEESDGTKISDDLKDFAWPLPQQIHIPKKQGPHRSKKRKVQRPVLPEKDGALVLDVTNTNLSKERTPNEILQTHHVERPDGVQISDMANPKLQQENVNKRRAGRPRKWDVRRLGLLNREYPIRSRKLLERRARLIKVVRTREDLPIKRARGRPRKYVLPGECSLISGASKSSISHLNQQLGTLSKKREMVEGDLDSECPPAKRRRGRPPKVNKVVVYPSAETVERTNNVQQSREEVCTETSDPYALPTRFTDVAPEEAQRKHSLHEDNDEELMLPLKKRSRFFRMGTEQREVDFLVTSEGIFLPKRKRGRPPLDKGRLASTADKPVAQSSTTLDPPMDFALAGNPPCADQHVSFSDDVISRKKAWNGMSEQKRKARELVARSLKLRSPRKTSRMIDAEPIVRLQDLRQTAVGKEIAAQLQKEEAPKKKGKSPIKCRYSMALLSCNQCNFATIEEKKMEQHREKTGHEATSSASLGEMEQGKPNSPQKMFKCSNCSYKNKEKAQVLRHKTRCGKNGARAVKQVPHSSIEEETQQSDLPQGKHKTFGKRYLPCKYCPFKTFRKYLLGIHMEHHDVRCKQRKRRCPFCSYGCNGTGKLRKHMQLHEDDPTVSHEIVRSDAVETTSVIDNEKAVATGDEEEPADNSDEADDARQVKVKCTSCPFETHIPLSLELHMKHHKPICPRNHLQCLSCTFVCKTKNHMTRHMKLHNIPAEPLREENHLDKNSGDIKEQAFYAYDFDLNQENCPEAVSVHTEVTKQSEVREQHVCLQCSVVFRSRYRLLIHKIQHATGTYLYCEECKFRTKKHQKYKFLAHLNAHFNMKPYKCKYCPYRARCYSTVFKHIINSHNTKMQHSRYRCNKCSFSCKALGWLKRHQALHYQGQVVSSEGNRVPRYDIEVENIIVGGKYKQDKVQRWDRTIAVTDDVSSTTIGSPQKHAGISCVREVQNTMDGSVELWFLCRFCGKVHTDQESWFAHVQRHIISSAWHPKNALRPQPTPHEDLPVTELHQDDFLPGEETENVQCRTMMENHKVQYGLPEDTPDTAVESDYASVQFDIDETVSQKGGEEKEEKVSVTENPEETADSVPYGEEDGDDGGNQAIRSRLNSTGTSSCGRGSNQCGSVSAPEDTDDDSDLPPELKTTNELELAFVFPPDKQAQLIREHLIEEDIASLVSEDNPVPSLQEIEPRARDELTHLPDGDAGSSAVSSRSVLDSEDQLSIVQNLTTDQKDQQTGPDLSAWISALEFDQTSEVEEAICTKVPGLPPGKSISCQFCGQQFAFQLKFLQHAKRHLL